MGGHPTRLLTPNRERPRSVSAIDQELEVPLAILTWTRQARAKQERFTRVVADCPKDIKFMHATDKVCRHGKTTTCCLFTNQKLSQCNLHKLVNKIINTSTY